MLWQVSWSYELARPGAVASKHHPSTQTSTITTATWQRYGSELGS